MVNRKNKFFLLTVVLLLAGCRGTTTSSVAGNTSSVVDTTPADIQYKEKVSETPVAFNGTNKSTFVGGAFDYSMSKLSTSENTIISPLTLGLNYSAVSLVSGSANAVKTKLGISSLAEFSSFNSVFNWNNNSGRLHRQDLLRSLTFHQIAQTNNTLSYLLGVRETLANDGIATITSSYANRVKDAQDFLTAKLGKKIPAPDLELDDPCVLTYSALRVKESREDAVTGEKTFHNLSGSTSNVNGDTANHEGVYWEGTDYRAFRYSVNRTDLTFVLPNENVSLSSVDATSAYLAGENGTKERVIDGFFPYFSLKETIDYTSEFADLFRPVGIYSGLVDNASQLKLFACKQANEFSFSEEGIEGTSLTVSGAGTASAPAEMPEISFVVDRPFYCFLSYYDIPLFAMTVANL